jgi:uncharacterized protein (DUF1501 family)
MGSAFHADMQDHMENLTIIMSEFAQCTSENGSLDTDRGHGSMMVVFGGHARSPGCAIRDSCQTAEQPCNGRYFP